MLAIENLVKHYKDGDRKSIKAVDGLTLKVEAGEFLALYGPNGSGKSTLLDLISGFQTPTAGTVTVAGRAVSQFSEREHANYLLWVLGIVGQPHELMSGATAQENAALKLLRPDARHAHRRIEPLLRQLGLGERMNLPVSKLSMGERQRVLIARALSLDPKLVLADEPTGHLDSVLTRDILALLRDLCRERKAAVVLATHDPQAVAYADQVRELHDGRLRPFGSSEISMQILGRSSVTP